MSNTMDGDEFEKGIHELVSKKGQKLLELLISKNFEEFVSSLPQSAKVHEGIQEVKELMEKLKILGITNIVFAQNLMRGFDYYTGIVFEVFDKNPKNKRSVFGGGRYDELLAIFGKDMVPAVGFGMGDVVMRDILETYNFLPKIKSVSQLHIAVFDEKSIGYAQVLAQKTRESGINTTIDYSGKKIGDQIKYADKNHIPFIVCIGEEEVKSGKLKVKELSTGKETEVTKDTLASVVQ